MIYLNAAGHGLPDARVRARMIAQLTREDEIGPIAAEAEAAQEMAAVRGKAAALIGADPGDVALVPSTTAGWNAAMLSWPVAGRRVIVAPGEWASNIALLQRLGARIEAMPVDGLGVLDLAALATRIDDDVAAIAAPMVCSLTGERYPVEAIGALPRPETCAFFLDAAQALGQMKVDVGAINCDVLATTTRKWLRGPRTTGFLWVRPGTLARMTPNLLGDYGALRAAETPIGDRDDVRRFEPMGTFAALRLGQGVALDLFEPTVVDRLQSQAGRLRARLSAMGFRLAGAEPARSAIVSIRTTPEAACEIENRLAAAGIVVKAPTPDCEPMRDPATVGGLVRITPHVYTTDADLDRLFEVLTPLAAAA